MARYLFQSLELDKTNTRQHRCPHSVIPKEQQYDSQEMQAWCGDDQRQGWYFAETHEGTYNEPAMPRVHFYFSNADVALEFKMRFG